MKRLIICFITILCLTAYVKIISYFSFFISRKIYSIFKELDPDNVFLVLTVHHICQAVITLLVIIVISKALHIKFGYFGFNFNSFRYSLKSVLIFIMIWVVIQMGVGSLLIIHYGVSPNLPFPMINSNFIGYFLFEILLSGTSEEIMFRSLVITVMASLWKDFFRNDKQLFGLVILASTAIFMTAHINFALTPFQIIHFNILQQLTCMVTGVFYGVIFIKTRSIVGCIIAHNLLNGVVVTVQLMFILMSR